MEPLRGQLFHSVGLNSQRCGWALITGVGMEDSALCVPGQVRMTLEIESS